MISDQHTMTATTDQWMTMQFYDQPSPDYDHNLFDQVSVMEGLISDVNNTVSSSPSPTNPKAVNNNGSRPIRRRSRSSKRTPTTLLNANTTNFRALVQQFTGCPSSTAMSFDVYKGPITLNFKQGSRQVIQHHHHHHNKSRTTVTTLSPEAATVKAPFGNTGFNSEGGHHLHQYQYQQQQQQLADQQQQWQPQDHQQNQQLQSVDDNLFDDNSDLFSSSINSSSISDGLIIDHDYSLQDLTNNAFFSSNNDVIQNGAYYM